MWYVYIVRCADDTLYTGITTDLERRIAEHNNSDLGSKYTRARRPVSLVYCEEVKNKSETTKREMEIKKMKRGQKEELIDS